VSVFHNETRLEMFVEFCGVHVSFPLPLSRSRRSYEPQRVQRILSYTAFRGPIFKKS